MKIECLGPAIFRIELDDAQRLAAHDPTLAEELCNEILQLADQDEVKAIILRVRETSPAAAAPAGNRPLRAYLGSAGLYQTLAFCKKVVIAELPGPIGPMGSLIGLYANLVVADAASAFPSPFDSVPEANFMMAALSMRLDRAKAWLLDTAPLSVEQAEEMGLVNVAAHAKDLPARALELAERAAAMPLDGITVSKMNYNACLDAMGAGQDFDLAEFFGAGMHATDVLGMK